jgi:hypothetical protein
MERKGRDENKWSVVCGLPEFRGAVGILLLTTKKNVKTYIEKKKTCLDTNTRNGLCF